MAKKKTGMQAAKTDKAAQGDLLPPDANVAAQKAGEKSAKPAPDAATTPPPDAPPVDETKGKRDYTPNPVVTEIPVSCPRCKSTNSRITKTTTFPHRPLEIAGKTYPGRICRRRTCLKCGRRYVSNAPYEPEPKPTPPKPCDLCDGRGMFPRDPKTGAKARLCPACDGSGLEETLAEDAKK